MFTRSSKWNVKSVILVALIGIIMGVIYTYGFNNVYNLVKLSFLPTGYAPVVDNVFTGLWYMAAPLAMYFVPTKGAGTIGELLAATVEMAIGGQWGALTIFEGLIQGAMNEIGFFPKKEIAIADIEALQPSILPVFSYSLSLDRIVIWKEGKMWMLISPQNEKEFVKLLKKFNPDIEIRNNIGIL